MSEATWVVKSLTEQPERWTLLEHTLRHESGRELWVSNGVLFLHWHGQASSFGWWQKWRIWRAYRRWCSVNSALSLGFKP